MAPALEYSREVAAALQSGRPVVALESTIISHGLPRPENLRVAREVEATVRRSRPVVLTAAAAVLAMVPLTGSIFWGPMAMAIMGGLIAATVLTLVFVPALYMVWLKPSGPGEPNAQAAPSVSLT